MTDFLADRIRNIRKKNNLTQKELAQKTGLSIASIQGYEQGKYKPKIEQLQKIASALNASLYDLIQYVEDINYSSQELMDLKNAVLNDPRTMLQYRDSLVMDPYHQLNEEGQNKAIELVELLTKIPEYKKNPEELENSLNFLSTYNWPAKETIPNLPPTDVEQTPEDIQHDLDIMNDDKNRK